jgi:hypothetical protein
VPTIWVPLHGGEEYASGRPSDGDWTGMRGAASDREHCCRADHYADNSIHDACPSMESRTAQTAPFGSGKNPLCAAHADLRLRPALRRLTALRRLPH